MEIKKYLNKEAFIMIFLGYIVIVFFVLSFSFLYAFSNLAYLKGWIEISPLLTFVVSIFCITPLAMPMVWHRLTKIKLLDFELSLSEVSSDISESLPNELKDTKRLRLGAALTPEIVSQLKQVMQSTILAELLEVNLSYGKAWFVSRLYLLAALSADYTNVKQIVFIGNFDGEDNNLIGLAPPSTVRNALALNYPDLEKAYRKASFESLTNSTKAISHPTDEIEYIVEGFGVYMQGFFDENQNNEWVSINKLREIINFAKYTESIEWKDDAIISSLYYKIMECNTEYVALRKNSKFEIINRLELATKVASLSLK